MEPGETEVFYTNRRNHFGVWLESYGQLLWSREGGREIEKLSALNALEEVVCSDWEMKVHWLGVFKLQVVSLNRWNKMRVFKLYRTKHGGNSTNGMYKRV